MSGDVQPRKRKDKKRKRDDEDPKEHHGVHAAKMGTDDIHLHVQSEHSTGGHWCAKILFFSLLAILLGLIGLIIVENRGLSDLDTPLSESRFSEYFEGWVDEHRETHDEHDVDHLAAELEDHDAEPFEEEEDHSEQDEDENLDNHEAHDDHDETAEHEDEEKTEETAEDEDEVEEDNADDEENAHNEEDDEENAHNEEDDEDENDQLNQDGEERSEEVSSHTRSKRGIEDTNDEDEDNDDEGFGDAEEVSEENLDEEKDKDSIGEIYSSKINQESLENEPPPSSLLNDRDTYEEHDTNKTHNKQEQAIYIVNAKKHTEALNMSTVHKNESSKTLNQVKQHNIKSSSKIKSQDDDDFESLENVVDNDADELLHLQRQKAEKEAQEHLEAEEQMVEEEPESASQIKSRSSGGPQLYTEDDYVEEELKKANEEMLQNNLKSALRTYESLILKYPDSPGARYGKAKVLDRLSETYQSNQMLTEAIESYKRFLALEDRINDTTLKEAAERCIDRMRFKGLNLQAVPIHQMLIKRFNTEPRFRNELALTYLLINRVADAKNVLQETLSKWPNDGYAQVHYGFVLKNLDNDLENAVVYLRNGIKSGANGTQDGRFYFNLGDALQRLGRTQEARMVYKEGAEKKLFLSEYQRSLYNVNGLNSKPFWTKEETTYKNYLDVLEKNWEKIKEEGLNALNEKGYFLDEAESLRDFGDWKQFELFARGYKNKRNCLKAPVTCSIIETFPAARFCKRGQTKFSVMHPGTHVWPHCGPTNCRLRAHLGLKIPPGTKIRIADQEKVWKEGEFLIFDDSFEHEVWHNGTSLRLVLIIDVWHPDLTEEQRRNLTPI